MKVHQRLFWLLVFLLPVQLGRHFWPEWSYVLGLKIDYLAPTVYLTDILVVGVLGLWFWENFRNSKFGIENYAKRFWWIIAIFLYLLVTSLLAQNSGAALYKFIKIIEFTLLGFYIAKNRYSISDIQYSMGGAVIYSSLIAIAQFFKQASLNGFFWWLGERSFNAFTPGISKAVWGGRLIMRPYATFPHPNVLAGFILVSLILLKNWKLETGNWKFFKWVAMALGIVVIAISFSRSTWLVGLLALPFVVYSQLSKKKIIIPVFLVIALCLVSLSYLAPQFSTEEAINQRLQLIKMTASMIKEQPLVGVGLNNFISQLPKFWQNTGFTYWLQPVHNIFLLVAAETGLLGLVIFLWFLILTFKKLLITKNVQPLLLLLVILTLGLFDHYWLTLQQSQLLFTIVLGLSWVKKR